MIGAFEVECTASIYSGILRMSDLLAQYPNLSIPLFVAAPESRRSNLMSQVQRPTFQRLDQPLAAVAGYISFENPGETVTEDSDLLPFKRIEWRQSISKPCAEDGTGTPVVTCSGGGPVLSHPQYRCNGHSSAGETIVRGFFKSSAGLVALLVVGLIIGAGGAATAAKLITGKDIKNGTITSADIKNGTIKSKDIKPATISEKRLSNKVKAKLNSGGAQGPKGDPGAPAPGGFTIKDGDGNAVGGFVSVDYDFFFREVDGGLWQYRWNGAVMERTIYFTDYDCAGTPLELWDSSIPPNPQRRVYGENGQGYRYGSNPPAWIESLSLFAKNAGCVNSSDPKQKVELVPVSAPPALKGPLTVKANP